MRLTKNWLDILCTLAALVVPGGTDPFHEEHVEGERHYVNIDAFVRERVALGRALASAIRSDIMGKP